MGGLLHLVQRGGAPGRPAGPPSHWGPAQSPPRCKNVTAHPSTASVPITVLLYDGPLLCGFNVEIKGSKTRATKKYFAVCLNSPDLFIRYDVVDKLGVPVLVAFGSIRFIMK